MARANYVAHAQKDNCAVKKGEPYWWWKFRHGGKHYSANRPRASQLTQSEYLSTIYACQENLEDSVAEVRKGKLTLDELADACDEQAEEVRTAGSECEDRRGNMPDALQESETGQLLQDRADACESTADELEQAAESIRELVGPTVDAAADDTEDDEADGVEKATEEQIDEAENIVSGISWPDE
jgi:hypothetical protein